MKNVDSITNKVKKVEKEVAKTIEKEVDTFNYKKDLKKRNKLDKIIRKEKNKADKKNKKNKITKKKKPATSYIKKAVKYAAWTIVSFSMLSIILFSGVVFANKSNYENKIIWGTEVFGEDLSGKSEEGVRQIVVKKIDEMRLKLIIDEKELSILPAEAGVEFKEDEIVEDILRVGKVNEWYTPWISSAASVVHAINFTNYNSKGAFTEIVPPKYEINEELFEEFIAGLSNKFNTESKNAALVMSGTEVQVIPAIYGRVIVADSIRAQIEDSISKNGASSIKIDVNEIQPDIIEEETKKSINLAQELISRSVVFTYKNKSYVPSKEIIGSWVEFSETNGVLVPKISENKIKMYLDNVAKGVDIPYVLQKVKVINGAERQVIQEGKNGIAVDTNSAARVAAEKLNTGMAVSMELPTYVVKFKTQLNNVLVADWAKYIEVNISTQTMCAYLAGGEKVNCWLITTGSRGWDTPIGTFLISRKSGAGGVNGGPGGGGVCMPNPPSTQPLCGINYVSTFTSQGHAIHEAWWRSYTSSNHFGNPNYGWNGSHGCVNAYYDVAKFIYYWAPLGTPVVIHY